MLFDQYPAVDGLNGARTGYGLQGIQCLLVGVAAINRHQNFLVGDQEVGIGGRQALAFAAILGRRQGQRDQGQIMLIRQALQFLFHGGETGVVAVAGILALHIGQGFLVHKAGQGVHVGVGVVAFQFAMVQPPDVFDAQLLFQLFGQFRF